MRIRFYRARILTMEEGREVFWGEIWTENDRVLAVLEKEKEGSWDGETDGKSGNWDREIDCDGNLLMPGFKDAHTHSPMTFLRSYADDLPLKEWLTKKIFPMEERLTQEDIYRFGRLAILEYLTSGITSIFDMYLMPKVMARASVSMGMRCCLVSGCNDFTSSVEEMEEEYEQFRQYDPLIRYHAGFHAEYTCSRKLLEKISDFTHKKKIPVFTHLSETASEVMQCREKYGTTPPAFLDGLGLFDYGGGGFHCVWLSEEDLRIFERRGLYVVTNPAANLKLASGIAPVAEFLRRGIPVAIGTDGPAGNNCLDFFRETFLVSALAKAKEEDAMAVNAMEVLRMATVNGAKVMGFSDCDVLAQGKAADLIMIDLKQPNMQPIHNVATNLIYSGSKSNVKMTMIAGKILYEDGKFQNGISREEIYEECEASMRRIFENR